MRAAGLPEAAVTTFARQLRRVADGATGLLPDVELEPVADVADAGALPDTVDADALDRAVVLKLNGGLGTSMGMSGPKSLVPAKDGRSFLDIIVAQVLALRARHGARLPLVLMDSFATSAATRAALARHPDVAVDVPVEFLQHRQPKLRADDLGPVAWPADPALEWCPPGHGDLYTALLASGMLATLLGAGYRYAFVSNADNLGAMLDPRILTWVAAQGAPFVMEVVEGTASDRKGGHIARQGDGRIVLRETAQTPPQDADSFRDFRRWRFYNTNNLWIDLVALNTALRDGGGALNLPVIVNRKTVDPRDPSSPGVLQLETAMGSAIGRFDGARALRVPRSRFAPVKTTDDLLVLRSDAYRLGPDGRVTPARAMPPFVELDPVHFRLLADFDARFPDGAPSLVGCDRLVVRGDVAFGPAVVLRGDIELAAPAGSRVHVAADG
jgi:UTP--glucose-1-phosphate uridylyltransferase